MNDIDQTQVTQNIPTPEAAAPDQSAAPAPSVTDIDGLSEFTWQGEKWTPDRWSKIYQEHRSLSEQSKSFAEEKRFAENLDADLDSVLKDPTLASKFKELYPKKYHGIVDRVLRTGQGSAQPTPAQNSLPPEVLARLENQDQRLKFFEERAYKAEVETASAHIDKVTKPLFDKFALANEDQVYARAETMISSGQKLTDAAWERLIRESHEHMTKKSDQFNGAKLKEQIEKGRRGADTGPGGSAPGQSPRKAKSLSEAGDEWYRQVTGTR